MKKLLLFDIDGTLLTGGGENRFVRAISNIYGLNIKSEKSFGGYTDRLIIAALLENEGWDDQQIESAIPKLLKEVDRVHQETFHVSHMKLLPGVKDLLQTLHQTDNVLGLITGNLEPIAKRKLKALGIWSYFSIGGFGSDPHTIRADLIRIAVKRAGFESNIERVYVIGDTPRDIEAAKAAGISNSVGVANGLRSTEELIEAGAKIVLEDFKDTSYVLEKLGINRPV